MSGAEIDSTRPGRGRHGRHVWGEFWEKDWSESDWLFDDVLARGRGHAIWAKHGQGKSLFTLWVCTELVKAGNVVVYLDFEMSEADLFERLSDMGIGPDTDLARLVYISHVDLPALDTSAGGTMLGSWLDDFSEEFSGHHLVVVVDTIGRAVIGEENSNDTVQAFYRHTGQELRRRGVTWVRLDHAGHEAEHARGASAKGDDVDVVWRLTTSDDGLVLRADKRRMGWVPDRVVFRRVEVPALRFERAQAAWPDGTRETARILDTLGVPSSAYTRTAQAALRKAGSGRQNAIIVAAQKYRRWRDAERLCKPVTSASEALSGATSGSAPGSAQAKPRNHGQEALREAPEALALAPREALRFPGREALLPKPATEPENWRSDVPVDVDSDRPFGGGA